VKGGSQDAGKSEVGRSRGPTWGKYRSARGWEGSTAYANDGQWRPNVAGDGRSAILGHGMSD